MVTHPDKPADQMYCPGQTRRPALRLPKLSCPVDDPPVLSHSQIVS